MSTRRYPAFPLLTAAFVRTVVRQKHEPSLIITSFSFSPFFRFFFFFLGAILTHLCYLFQPAYQNLRQKVDNFVSSHLSTQDWNPSINKNQMRNGLRQSVVQWVLQNNLLMHLIINYLQILRLPAKLLFNYSIIRQNALKCISPFCHRFSNL